MFGNRYQNRENGSSNGSDNFIDITYNYHVSLRAAGELWLGTEEWGSEVSGTEMRLKQWADLQQTLTDDPGLTRM